jgi:hypothetical protein
MSGPLFLLFIYSERYLCFDPNGTYIRKKPQPARHAGESRHPESAFWADAFSKSGFRLLPE